MCARRSLHFLLGWRGVPEDSEVEGHVRFTRAQSLGRRAARRLSGAPAEAIQGKSSRLYQAKPSHGCWAAQKANQNVVCNVAKLLSRQEVGAKSEGD